MRRMQQPEARRRDARFEAFHRDIARDFSTSEAAVPRVRDESRDGPGAGPAIGSLEQPAQLLALWRPGAAGQPARQPISPRVLVASGPRIFIRRLP